MNTVLLIQFIMVHKRVWYTSISKPTTPPFVSTPVKRICYFLHGLLVSPELPPFASASPSESSLRSVSPAPYPYPLFHPYHATPPLHPYHSSQTGSKPHSTPPHPPHPHIPVVWNHQLPLKAIPPKKSRNPWTTKSLTTSVRDKVFKSGPSKICGRQPLKAFTWSILEYIVPFVL